MTELSMDFFIFGQVIACKNRDTLHEQATVVMRKLFEQRAAKHASTADSGIYALL